MTDKTAEQTTSNLVAPPEGKRKNFYLRVVLFGMVGILSGGTILLFYIAFLLPAFGENLRTMGIVAVFLMIGGFLINYFISIRRTKRLIEWMKKDNRDEAIEEELWHDARECATKLPRLSATASLILWLTAPMALALIMFLLGNFGWYQAFITAISGLLIGPLNALMYFYVLRRVMYQVLKRLSEYPITPREINVPNISLRFKLIFTSACLVICPMLFAVMLDRNQQDRQDETQRKLSTENTLQEAADIWLESNSRVKVGEYINRNKISKSFFLAVDKTGMTISGGMPDKYKRRALERIYKGAVGTVYLQQIDRLLSVRVIEGNETIHMMFVYHRLSDTRGFWSRNWLIVFLIFFLGSIGLFLGIQSSQDAMRPVLEMMKSGDGISRGDFSLKGVYLNDDELAKLGEVFNDLMESIKAQFDISDKMVEDIRSTIVGLSKDNEDVSEVLTKQRMGVGDQMMGLSQAQSVSGQITDAARSIQERAGAIRDIADRTSTDCGTSREVLDGASERMRLIGASMEEISSRMVDLTAHHKNILEVVKMIEEINERTEMISLNASLEAVGAKRAGSRFAVVAQEVRRLAEKTAQSTTEIQTLFESIQESSAASIETVEDGQRKVQHGLEMMGRLNESFEEISENAKSTSESVAQIHLMTTQQTTACLQMQDTIADVADAGKVVEEGADLTEKSISSLSGLTDNLKTLIQTDDDTET